MTILNQLIEEAYGLFSDYEFGKHAAVCTYCCMDESEVAVLRKTPLREVTSQTLFQYLDAACEANDVKLINQMRYLLPRILELHVAGHELRHSNEILLNKLYCKNSVWKRNEIQFLKRFAIHYFDEQLKTDGFNCSIESILETIVMFDTAGLGADELLNHFQDNIDNKHVINVLMGFITVPINNPFADDALDETITNFIHSKTLKDSVISSFMQKIEQDLSEEDRLFYEVAFDVFVNA